MVDVKKRKKSFGVSRVVYCVYSRLLNCSIAIESNIGAHIVHLRPTTGRAFCLALISPVLCCAAMRSSWMFTNPCANFVVRTAGSNLRMRHAAHMHDMKLVNGSWINAPMKSPIMLEKNHSAPVSFVNIVPYSKRMYSMNAMYMTSITPNNILSAFRIFPAFSHATYTRRRTSMRLPR